MTLPLKWMNPVLDYENNIFQFTIKSKHNLNLSAIEASQHTVNYICNNYPPPYNLCVSGGVDSQAMLYAWYLSGQKFTCYTAIYNDNLNLYDLETLDMFSKKYGIKVDYINLDLLSFYEQEHYSYVTKYLCGSPHITAYMKIADIIQDGTVIFSGNFLSKDHLRLMPNNVMGLYHYSVLSERSCVPFFLCETPELAHGFIEKEKAFPNGYERKVFCYTSNGFPVIPQNRYVTNQNFGESGQTGFEKVKEYFDINENLPREITIQDRIAKCTGQTSKRNFDLLYRNKYEAMYANTKYVIYA